MPSGKLSRVNDAEDEEAAANIARTGSRQGYHDFGVCDKVVDI